MDRTTGRYVYAEENPLLDMNGFKVTDERGNAIPTNFYKAEGSASETPYYKVRVAPLFQSGHDNGAYLTEVCKRYYVRYAENDLDTMTICFKVAKQKCGDYFEKLAITFSSGASYSGNDIFAEMRVYKRSR